MTRPDHDRDHPNDPRKATLSRWVRASSWGTARAGRPRAWRRSSTACGARGLDATRHRPARSARPRTPLPAFHSRGAVGGATSWSAGTRTAAASRAWPRPSRTRPTPPSSCSATRSTRRARPSGPTPGSPTGRPSPARSCCCRASPTRSRGSTCCGPRSRCLRACRARHLPAPRAHAQAGPRRRPGPRRGVPRSEGPGLTVERIDHRSQPLRRMPPTIPVGHEDHDPILVVGDSLQRVQMVATQEDRRFQCIGISGHATQGPGSAPAA